MEKCAVALTSFGAGGRVTGLVVTGPAFAPAPAGFTACTSKAYCVPLVRLDTVTPVSSPVLVPASLPSGTSVHVALDDTVEPAEYRYRYFEMNSARAPVLVGAVQAEERLPVALIGREVLRRAGDRWNDRNAQIERPAGFRGPVEGVVPTVGVSGVLGPKCAALKS